MQPLCSSGPPPLCTIVCLRACVGVVCTQVLVVGLIKVLPTRVQECFISMLTTDAAARTLRNRRKQVKGVDIGKSSKTHDCAPRVGAGVCCVCMCVVEASVPCICAVHEGWMRITLLECGDLIHLGEGEGGGRGGGKGGGKEP